MQSDIKLKIRHAKRANATELDLSNMGISGELPIDVSQLTMLERINIANNKLISLKNLDKLPNLREIYAANNNIS